MHKFKRPYDKVALNVSTLSRVSPRFKTLENQARKTKYHQQK